MPIRHKKEHDGRTLVDHVSGTQVAADSEHFIYEFGRLVGLYGKLRVLFDLSCFHGRRAGALWKDSKVAMHHFGDIARLVTVGEKKWQEGMATFGKPCAKAGLKYFDLADGEEARKRLAEA